jgi:L-ascorbate metabolism protein UlaG (beta-lactamase superfamily)
MESSGRKVFFSGDGGYNSRFKHFGEQFPDIDLAIMENGQYDTNWSQIHTMPEHLGQAVAELGARRFVTVHHSKFCLSNHPWDEPRKNECKAAEQFGLQLVTCQIGELVGL